MKEYHIALAGCKNVGKTTIFQAFTGRNQKTCSWPGKDLLISDGKYLHGEIIYHLTDLPSICSLTGNGDEQEIVKEVLLHNHTDAFLVICDATSLDETLSLALQILEVTGNVIVCLNKIDLAKKKHLHIDYDALSASLTVPVLPICAKKRDGLVELIDCLDKQHLHAHKAPRIHPYPSAMEEAITTLEEVLSSSTPDKIPVRWTAVQLLTNSHFPLTDPKLKNEVKEQCHLLWSSISKLGIKENNLEALIASSFYQEAVAISDRVTQLNKKRRLKLKHAHIR